MVWSIFIAICETPYLGGVATGGFKWDSKIAGQRRAIFLAYKEVKNMHQNSLMFAKDLFFAAETM